MVLYFSYFSAITFRIGYPYNRRGLSGFLNCVVGRGIFDNSSNVCCCNCSAGIKDTVHNSGDRGSHLIDGETETLGVPIAIRLSDIGIRVDR